MKFKYVIFATMVLLPAAGAAATRDANPAISVNTLFLGQWNDDTHTAEENFVKLQEAEMQFSAVVDPFWAADLVLAVHPAHDHGDEPETQGLLIDLEIAELRSLVMPAGFGLTLGRFYLPLGKHATLHTHQYPFANVPIAQRLILGEHGPTDTGAILDYSLPLPWWSELRIFGVNGDIELFDGDDADPAYGAHFTNLWDLGDDATFELGGSWLTGPGALDEGMAGDVALYGVDLTWKWTSSARTHGPAAVISAEAYLPDAEHGDGDPLGWFAHAQYRVHRNWWLSLGYGQADDMAMHDHDEKAVDHEVSDWREWKTGLAFAPSEFSSLRAELTRLEEVDGERDDLRLSVQWNFTIGSHPAHRY